MHSFLVKTSIQHFFILLPVRYLKNTIFFRFSSFYFSENRKKIIRVGEFLTGSVGPGYRKHSFFFFFCLSELTEVHVFLYDFIIIYTKQQELMYGPITLFSSLQCNQNVTRILSINTKAQAILVSFVVTTLSDKWTNLLILKDLNS